MERCALPWATLAVLVLCLLALPFMLGILPLVEFPREEIRIEIYPDHVVVKGLYTYYNPHAVPAVQGLAVPLPVDRDHPPPIGISARQVSPREEVIALRNFLGTYRFDLRIPPRDEVQVEVRYRQQSPKKSATYILTTTKPWRDPLDRGEYRLIPKGVRITDSNYPLGEEEGKLVFTRVNFMPTENWSFSWEVKG